MASYGYLNHTSTDRRDEAAMAAMFAALPCECITLEQSWSRGEKRRPAFMKLMNTLRAGDTLFVGSIDRLGVSAGEAAQIWKTVTQTLGADIVVLDAPELDTRRNPGIPASCVRAAAEKAFAAAERAAESEGRRYTVFSLVDGRGNEKKDA